MIEDEKIFMFLTIFTGCAGSELWILNNVDDIK